MRATKQTDGVGRDDAGTRGRGFLIVFEGPDGVGKTSLAAVISDTLRRAGDRSVASLAFPGREAGTLGRHVYELHHNPKRLGVERIDPVSLQLLHIAAHIDLIENRIRPHVEAGGIVVLDRFWWSTWVYGVTSGASRDSLSAMIELEKLHWREVQPDAVVLVHRASSLRPNEDPLKFNERATEYERLADVAASTVPVIRLENEQELGHAVHRLIDRLRPIIEPHP